jgi:prepilin-type N-terminal cleavage/methylation domain-containing protein
MRTSLLKSSKTLARAGFTLIELMAVVVIIGILMIYLLPKIPAAFDAAKVTACKNNMKNIYSGITTYYGKYNRLPKEGGVRFFAALITDEVWENSASNAKTLTCPGLRPARPRLADRIPGGSRTPRSSTAVPPAGRNVKEHTRALAAGESEHRLPARTTARAARTTTRRRRRCSRTAASAPTRSSRAREGTRRAGGDLHPRGSDSLIEELSALSLD